MFEIISRVSSHINCEITSIFGGIAGNCHCHSALYQYLKPRIRSKYFEICDDTYSVISSVLGHQDGCGLVAGTGSSLFVRASGAGCIHIGGWGYLIDTGGSGYDLGRDALYMALRATDGRGKKTVLNQLLEQDLGRPVEEAIAEIYAGGRSYIASFAHTVFEGRRLGDPVCAAIFNRGVQRLSELVYTAAKYYPGTYSVVLGGGLFSAFPEYVEALRRETPSCAQLLTTNMPVVYGAAIEALWGAGYTASEPFKRQFLQDYRRLWSNGCTHT